MMEAKAKREVTNFAKGRFSDDKGDGWMTYANGQRARPQFKPGVFMCRTKDSQSTPAEVPEVKASKTPEVKACEKLYLERDHGPDFSVMYALHHVLQRRVFFYHRAVRHWWPT